jgi:hypothetical protein
MQTQPEEGRECLAEMRARERRPFLPSMHRERGRPEVTRQLFLCEATRDTRAPERMIRQAARWLDYFASMAHPT